MQIHKFKQLAGTHTQNELDKEGNLVQRTYQPGETIESSTRLDQVHGTEKYQYLGSREVGPLVPPTVQGAANPEAPAVPPLAEEKAEPEQEPVVEAPVKSHPHKHRGK